MNFQKLKHFRFAILGLCFLGGKEANNGKKEEGEIIFKT